jgi:xylulokinase
VKGPDAQVGPAVPKSFLLTLDVGTTAVKGCLFSSTLERLGFATEEYDLCTSGTGTVELDPEIYWVAFVRVARKAMAASGVDPLLVSAVAVTTQGETLIPVDDAGLPVRKAIVWLDARADSEATQLRTLFAADAFYRTTGISEIGPSCPVAKVLWIRDREPEVFARTARFLLLLDFLLFRLTGRFVTDRCILSSTGYFDINAGEFWPDMLSTIGVDAARFPEILDCGTYAGGVLPGTADELGIAVGTPVVSAGMDQAVSALGAGNYEEGIVTETTGTALVVAATVAKPFYDHPARLNIMRHAVEGLYLVLPYNQTAGMVLKWFKDEFCRDLIPVCAATGPSIYACIDEMAADVAPLSGGLLVLPHFMGMLTPEVDPSVRGVFFGVGLDTTRWHFARAILEGIAYMLRENLELLASMGIAAKEIRSLGGGARSGLWCRIKADVTGLVVHVMPQEESTSLGAAMLAARYVGMNWKVDEASSRLETRCIYPPDPANGTAYNLGFHRYHALLSAMRPLFI